MAVVVVAPWHVSQACICVSLAKKALNGVRCTTAVVKSSVYKANLTYTTSRLLKLCIAHLPNTNSAQLSSTRIPHYAPRPYHQQMPIPSLAMEIPLTVTLSVPSIERVTEILLSSFS